MRLNKPDFEWWTVGRGSYWLQSRSQAVSSYLRTLKCLRKVGYAVIGNHMSLWAFDGTKRKLRSIVHGIEAALKKHDPISVENQPEPRRGRRVARRPSLPISTPRRRRGPNSDSPAAPSIVSGNRSPKRRELVGAAVLNPQEVETP
jgi:hypothetical protein